MEELTKISDLTKDPEMPLKIRAAMEAILKSLKYFENRLQNLEIRMTLISRNA